MNAQLIKFIELCLEDGVITDKEREVIFRKSKELGVPDDECEILIASLLSKHSKNPTQTETTKKAINPEYNQMYCSSDDKVILGFCGGLAHKYNQPVNVVRLAMFLAAWFMLWWVYFVALFLPKLPTKNV
jgi:phage shock protein PspC (stress-responsive transcriptional regulator)